MKVLLVDDSKSARYALRLQLQRHGMMVETADAAESALERVQGAPPDAIFMDHTMPGMNGFEALDILKATPSTAHIPVVMCTSNEDPEYIAQAQKKGAVAVLSKSTAPEKLGDLLDRLQQTEAAPADALAATFSISEPAPDDPSRAEVAPKATDALTEEWFEERLLTLVEPLIDDRAERLAEDLLAKTDERLVFGLAKEAERLQQQLLKDQSEQAQLTTNRLLKDSLPQVVRQQIEQERQQIAQMVQERINGSLNALIEEPSFVHRVSGAVSAKVSDGVEKVAKRRATEIAETVATRWAEEVAGHQIQSSKRSNGLIYLLAAIAASVGVASAVAVYYLLR